MRRGHSSSSPHGRRCSSDRTPEGAPAGSPDLAWSDAGVGLRRVLDGPPRARHPGIPAHAGERGRPVVPAARGSARPFPHAQLLELARGDRGLRRADVALARYYPEDQRYLLEFEPTVVHYEVTERDVAGLAVDHVELFVPDRAVAAEWYARVLGCRSVPGTEQWAGDPRGPLMVSPDGGPDQAGAVPGRHAGSPGDYGLPPRGVRVALPPSVRGAAHARRRPRIRGRPDRPRPLRRSPARRPQRRAALCVAWTHFRGRGQASGRRGRPRYPGAAEGAAPTPPTATGAWWPMRSAR